MKMQDINLGVDKAPIALPKFLCLQAAIQATVANRFSIVGVILNPKQQNLYDILEQLPSLWGLKDNVVGRIIDSNKFQFLFQTEESMNHVLTRGPWSFNGWMLVVQRWAPNITEEELKIIPFWIQIRGIPLQYLTGPMVKSIGEYLGHVENVDFDEATNRVDFVKVKVYWNINNPLRFQRKFQFDDAEIITLSFNYERLSNFCVTCGMLTHEKKDCPLRYDDDHLAAGPSNSSGELGEKGASPVEERYMPVEEGRYRYDDYHLAAGPSNASINIAEKSPSLIEDKDMMAETWRYMQAKIAKGKFNAADFQNLLSDYIKEEEDEVSKESRRGVEEIKPTNEDNAGNQTWCTNGNQMKISRKTNNNEGLFGCVYSDMSQDFDYDKVRENEERHQMIRSAKGKLREDEYLDMLTGYDNKGETSSFNKRKRDGFDMMLQNPRVIDDYRMVMYPINKKAHCESNFSYSVTQVKDEDARVPFPPQSP